MPQSSSQEKRLEFIVTTNPAATKDATIRAARSHVKREFFRQKRLRDVQNFANQQSSSNSSSGATSSRTACPEGQSGSNRCSNEFKPASRDLNVGPYHPSDHLLLDDTPDVKVEESSEQNLIPTIWRESTTGALPLRSGTGSRSSPNYGLSYTIYDQEQPYSHPGSRASADSDVSVDDDFTIPANPNEANVDTRYPGSASWQDDDLSIPQYHRWPRAAPEPSLFASLFPESHHLFLDYYFSEVQQLRASGCKISLQSPLQGWAQAFNFNEALFHASSLATYGALTYGKLEDLEASSTTMVALFHRGAAIRAVNAALDDPKARFSDENIAAIISLASVEFYSGNTFAMNDHLGGLKEMVKLLGGYEKIRANNGLLGSLVEMLDRLFYATQPRGFSILRRESEVFAPLIEFPNQSQLFSLSKTGIIPVSDPILPLLFAVFKTWDSQFARNNPGYNRVNFVNGCACLYQKIISMEQVNLITETLQDNIFLFQACRLAGLVFSSRGLNLPPKTVQLWVHSLKTRMEPLCHGGYWGLHTGAMLWCLLVGATQGYHSPMRGLFSQVKPVAVTVRNKTSELRMNQIQIVGTHNSYHRETYLEERPAMEIMLSDPQNYYYSHASLKDQLSYQSVRNLELDLWPDPEGGLYATPLIRRLAGLDPPSDPAMNKSGTKILHVSDAEVGTSCHTLVECLTEVKEWSIANPSHVPIPFMVEFKHTDSSMEYLGGVHSPRWTNTTLLDALDEEIRSVFSDEQMITPDDVRHEDMTLEQSILNYGWPTLEEARGKVLFLMDDGSKPLGDVRDAYRANGHESLEGRVIFTQSNPGETDAAFLKRNDPMGNNLATIQKLVTKGYWVRTRADVPIDTVLSGSTIMRDNAFASGAQIVSTDFPGVGMAARYKSDYVVRLPGGAAARCNPINSPASCNGTVLEKLS